VDQWLARGKLSGARREAILDRVLAVTATSPCARPWGRWRVWQWGSGLAAAAALAGAVVVWAPRAGDPDTEGFQSRGATGRAFSIEAGCREECRLGDTLLFRVQHVVGPAYLAAFAITAQGQRIWYFPSDHGELPTLPVTEAAQLLARGVALGEPHQAGVVHVHLVVSPRPVTREQVVALLAAESLPKDVLHLVQPLTIAP